MSLADRLHRLVVSDADARPVALARMVLGVAALLKLLLATRTLTRLVDPGTIRLPMAPWLPQPTPAMVTILLGLWAVAGLCFLVGWQTRTAGLTLTLLLGAQLVLDQQTYSNHLYLLTLSVGWLTLADAAAVWSLDARGRPRPHVRAWPVFLLKVQVSIVYAFAAISKLTPDYLSGLALAPFVPFQVGIEYLGFTATATIVLVLSWITIPLELMLAVYLWSSRRAAAMALMGVVLHTGMVTLMYRQRLDLAIFAVLMWGLYLLFTGPSVLSLLQRLVGPLSAGEPVAGQGSADAPGRASPVTS
jgi:Vitamin K-dependent gamma-carboxylase